jgi:uncharacterized protein YdcH (DUF465 family)
MYDDEDGFYDNYNEFDAQIKEFQQGLIKGVKQQFLDKLNQLTEENAHLQSIADRMQEIEKEHQAKLRELDKEKQSLVYKVRQERISQLFADRKTTMYHVTYKYIDKPKCDECNDKREIVFLSPQGKSVKTKCKCADTDKIFVPELNEAYEISIHNIDNNIPRVWFRARNEGKKDEYFSNESTDYCDATYSGQEYSSLDKYGTFFAEQTDCQKYCDYLNNKEGK